jgi:hypothetical protein
METARPIESEIRPEKPSPQTLASPPPLRKRPFVAAAFAFFPGIGNVYNGLYLRGAAFFAVIASLIAMGAADHEEHGVLGFVIAFVWIFNVIDSMRQAQLINLGYAQDLGLEDAPRVPKASQGGLLAGLLFLVIGILASLQLYFDIELSWMLRYWPLGLIGIGVWLVAAWLRERRKRDEPAEDAKMF